MKIPNRRKLINTGSLFAISLIVIVLTILSVWFYGIGTHKTVIENSLISTSILSIAFFLFITIGLYKGIKLKDTLGKFTPHLSTKKTAFLKDINLDAGIIESGSIAEEGIGGLILNIILWLIVTVVLSYLFFILGTFIWFSIVLFIAMLYWLFFRAIRLIFKKSLECSGNVEKSVFYGIMYTLLYVFWIYVVIVLVSVY